MRLVFLGAPGAGKGTQAEYFANELSVPHLATGDMLRAAVTEGSTLGKQAEKIMKAGDLVPDELMISLIGNALAQIGQKGFILDGFPRTKPQGKALTTLLNGANMPLDGVILFDVNEDAILQRIKGRIIQAGTHSRADDTACVLRRRIKVYRKETAPLIGYYQEQGLLHSINGMADIESVSAQIALYLKGNI